MNIQINAKVESLNELNSTHTFEPNQHGLYNVSLMHRIFNAQKHELDKANPESWLNKFPESFDASKPTAHELASRMMLEGFADDNDLLLKDSNGDYWGNVTTFMFLMKGVSNLFADSVNNLESGQCTSYKDYAIEYSKKYSVFFPQLDNMEGYRAYCIHQLSKIFCNLNDVYDYTVNSLIHFDGLADRTNLDYDTVTLHCWKISYNHINNLIGDLLKFDPQLQDHAGFTVRYRTAIQTIKEETEKAFPAKSETKAAPDTVGKKVDKFLRKFF